jgi:homoserine dehydrogenase
VVNENERAPPVVVLKFGSSVLRSVAELPSAVHEIYRWYRDGFRVLAVVSAIGRATEELLAQAREISSAPSHRRPLSS